MSKRRVSLFLASVLLASGCSEQPLTTRARGTERPGSNAGSGPAAAGSDSAAPPAADMNPTPLVTPPARPQAPQLQPSANGPCGAVMQKAQNTLQPVDIVFSIDTSGTMRDEITFVKANMNAFSKQIRDAGIDVRVILIAAQWTGMEDPFGGLLFTDGLCIDAPLGSGKCPEDSNPPNYTHIVEVIGQWNILDAYIYKYPEYRQHLREHSLKTFVSVSDDNASTGADKFVSDVKALEPSSGTWSNWRYSAIYPFAACGDGAAAPTHADLVVRTQGVGGDLCKQDFAPVFNEIAEKLTDTVRLACDWAIPAPPSGESFEPTKTNVQLSIEGNSEMLLKAQASQACGMKEGWHYDDEAKPARVVACPASCARIQAARTAEISLLFGCATQIVPG